MSSQLEELELLFYEDKYQELIENCEGVINSNNFDLKEIRFQLEVYYYLNRSYESQRKYKKVLTNIKLIEEKFKDKLDLITSLLILIPKLYPLFRLGKFEKGIEIFNQNNFENINEIYEQDKPWLALFYNISGLFFYNKGNLDKALKILNKSLDLKNDYSNPINVSTTIGNIGNIYFDRGDLDKALEYYQESHNIISKTSNLKSISNVLHQLGGIYAVKGDFDTSISFYQKSMSLNEKIGQSSHIILYDLGKIFAIKNKFDEALENFFKAVKFYIETISESTSYLAKLYMEIIKIYIQLENHNDANKYFIEIEKISLLNSNKYTQLRYKFAKALILKQKNKIRDRANAMNLFFEIVNAEIIDFPITYESMINYIDDLLLEFKLTNNLDSLNEITALIKKIKRLSKKMNIYPLLVECFLLEAKLELIQGNLENPSELFNQSLSIAKEKGFIGLIEKINKEINLFETQKIRWKIFINQNPSKKEIIKEVKIEEYLKEISRFFP